MYTRELVYLLVLYHDMAVSFFFVFFSSSNYLDRFAKEDSRRRWRNAETNPVLVCRSVIPRIHDCLGIQSFEDWARSSLYGHADVYRCLSIYGRVYLCEYLLVYEDLRMQEWI